MPDFIVTNTNDSGPSSLRDAVQQANALATFSEITFDQSIARSTIILQSPIIITTPGSISINGDIFGTGDPAIAISGDSDQSGNNTTGDTSLFTIAAGSTAVLASLELRDGYAVGGNGILPGTPGADAAGAITNAGTLYVNDCFFYGNDAVAGDGASSFSTAGANGGNAAGAILNYGTTILTDTFFDSNSAVGGDGGFGGTTATGFDGGNGGHAAGVILNVVGGYLQVNQLGHDVSSAVGGTGGNGGGAVSNGSGGDGGVGGSASAIVNLGQASGLADIFSTSSQQGGAGGSGGFGSPIGQDGNPGLTDPTFVNYGGTGQIQTGTYTVGTSGANTATLGINENYAGLGGDDIINGSYGSIIYGGSGNDIITAPQPQAVFGGTGNDQISADVGSGISILGEEGHDWVVMLDFVSNGGHWNGGDGDDTADFSQSATLMSLIVDLSTNTTNLSMNIFNFENVIGMNSASHVDQLIGDAIDNRLSGLAGDDQISGNGGDDTIEGGAGADNLDGGSNGPFGDTLSYAGSSAGVTVFLASNTVSGGDADGDTVTGFENVTGSDQVDYIYGDANSNTINGNGGADWLYGGDDHDTLNGGAGADLMFGDAGGDTMNGGDDGDYMWGGTGPDTMHGNDGVDWMRGEEDEDLLYGDAGDDVLIGGAGDDQMYGGFGTDTFYGEDDNDWIYGEANGDVAFGQLGDDYIYGDSEGDFLFGGAGADTINGGTENDLMWGDMPGQFDGATDTFQFDAGWGFDAVYDFELGVDQVRFTSIAGLTQFSNLTLIDGGANVTVVYGSDAITFYGVTQAELEANQGDFSFS
ncbi:MAG: calcium-binding protein [Nitratireductor sp.]